MRFSKVLQTLFNELRDHKQKPVPTSRVRRGRNVTGKLAPLANPHKHKYPWWNSGIELVAGEKLTELLIWFSMDDAQGGEPPIFVLTGERGIGGFTVGTDQRFAAYWGHPLTDLILSTLRRTVKLIRQ